MQPGGRKGWHSSGMPAAAGTGRWAPAAPTPLGAGSGPPGLSLLGKGTASCWGTGTSSLCPLGVSFPPQGKLRHGGLGQSKAASLPLALAGVLAFGTSLILYPAAISGPRQGNTPLILEGLNPAEGSSFPAASSHQRHLGHPRHTQSRVSLLPPPCLSTRREDLGGQGLWHGTADPHPHQSFPKTPRLDHLSLSRSVLSTHLRALTGGCYLNICGV